MTNKLVGNYKNGTYFVKIYEDGTKERIAPFDTFEPNFAESMDMTITERCQNLCEFCYAGCTPQGKHADFSKYEHLIDSLHPYTELALNGNNLDIPELEDFLRKLKDKKVFANMTVNQIDFEKNWRYLKRLTHEGLIHGIGISLNKITDELLTYIQFFPNAILHVILGIFTEEQYNKLKDRDLKILILGYKQLGRGVEYSLQNSKELTKNHIRLYRYLPEMVKHFNVVSFDNLAIEQLDVKRLMNDEKWDEFYMGAEGSVTFFVNLVQGYFAMNSLSPNHYPITEGMTIDDMFKIVRKNNGII